MSSLEFYHNMGSIFQDLKVVPPFLHPCDVKKIKSPRKSFTFEFSKFQTVFKLMRLSNVFFTTPCNLYNCILGILYFIHFPLTHVTRDFHEDFKVEQPSLSFFQCMYIPIM